MRNGIIVVCAVGLAALGAACGGRGLDRVPEGNWGGAHVSLAVTAAAATVEFDCAHGKTNGPLVLDRDGRFGVAGVFMREGGPVRDGEPPDAHPAFYEGSTDGRTLSLTVTLTDQGQTLGPFEAVRGAPPRVLKCL